MSREASIDIINLGFCVLYIRIEKQKDNKLYIGHSDDLTNRIVKHNKDFVLSRKHRMPLKLVYYEACLAEDKAIRREKYFKTGFGRIFLKGRI